MAKRQKDKQRSTKHYTETENKRSSNTNPQKTGGCSGRVGSSCSTNGIRRVAPVTNSMTRHERWTDLELTYIDTILDKNKEPSWPWSYGNWIYYYLCSQCLSPLTLWVRISIKARCKTLCDKVCQWLAIGWWFSLGHPVSSTNKTDHHDIAKILLKVALNTIKQTNKSTKH